MVTLKTIKDILKQRLRGEALSIQECCTLVYASILTDVAAMIIEAAMQLALLYNNKVFLLSPLYVSSYCCNDCEYCEFGPNCSKKLNLPEIEKTHRGERLSLPEFVNEGIALLDMNYRNIELVFGQDTHFFKPLSKQMYDVTKLCEYVKELKKIMVMRNGGGMIVLNAPPLDIEAYKKLSNSIDMMLLWLETSNILCYRRYHGTKYPKSDYPFRQFSFGNAHDGDIKYTAGGYLAGLSPWRDETLALLYHDRYLKEKYGRNGFKIIGTPRYKGNLEIDASVSDDEYLLSIALYRLIFDGIPWIQTRESAELNKKIIDTFGGRFILTKDCSTAVGGYSKKAKGKMQFPVHRYTDEIFDYLKEKGIQPVYDWDESIFNT